MKNKYNLKKNNFAENLQLYIMKVKILYYTSYTINIIKVLTQKCKRHMYIILYTCLKYPVWPVDVARCPVKRPTLFHCHATDFHVPTSSLG